MSFQAESTNMKSTEGSNTKMDTQNEMHIPNKKRKAMEPTLEVWGHFFKFVSDEGEIKGRCNYCKKEICCDPKKYGTIPFNSHLKTCKKYSPNIDAKQVLLNLQPAGQDQEGEGSTLANWKFDQKAIKNALAYMIIVDELPFKFVEGEGFKHFMSLACPQFSIPSRCTVTKDCYQLYLNERLKLKHFLKNSCERVCLTIDTWTSLQGIKYMCLTAHFTDNDWNLNKRILNFCPISSHRAQAIGEAVEKCLLDWGIDKVMTITMDNSSSNNVAIDYLKEKFANWGSNVLNGKFLHIRSVAHIINLVVVDGLKEVGESVTRVRAAVRYVRQSPARLKEFKECVELERIQSKSSLCLDVSTRWNTTYLMLDAALKFRRAFDRFDDQDPCYRIKLEPTAEDISNGKVEGKGKPNYSDWENVKIMVKFLKNFYHLTLQVSGSLYVTLDDRFHEISGVDCVLQEWIKSEDIELHMMASKMKQKYEKYRGDVKKMNLLIYVAVVLDPRLKLKFIEFALTEMYGGELGLEMGKKVKDVVYDLFNEYKKMYTPPQSGQSSSSEKQQSSSEVAQREPGWFMRELYKKYKIESRGGKEKSELDWYLGESREYDNGKFDILEWWKICSSRFPILSHLARDVLAVPISTVASESVFSMGERVLDAFRSSLTPTIAQALICSQDWLRSSSLRVNVEEDLTELEKLENEFSTMTTSDTDW